jgi:hypothetical protein
MKKTCGALAIGLMIATNVANADYPKMKPYRYKDFHTDGEPCKEYLMRRKNTYVKYSGLNEKEFEALVNSKYCETAVALMDIEEVIHERYIANQAMKYAYKCEQYCESRIRSMQLDTYTPSVSKPSVEERYAPAPEVKHKSYDDDFMERQKQQKKINDAIQQGYHYRRMQEQYR